MTASYCLVHEQSDRFIIVFEGRGLFHLSSSRLEDFEGSDVRSVPIRSRDVLIFPRGVLHTFSAPDEQMVLLSYQSPFIEFDDPRQYTMPEISWMPSQVEETGQVACDPAWTVLLG